MNGSSCEMDGARHQTDASRSWTDNLTVSDSAEMAVVSHEDEASTYLSIRDTKRSVRVTDSIRSHADMSTGHNDILRVKTNVIITANAPEIISTTRQRMKPPDLPIVAARCAPDKPNGLGNCTDTLSMHMGIVSQSE